MLERELEVAYLIEGREHRKEAIVECAREDMISGSYEKENKVTSK